MTTMLLYDRDYTPEGVARRLREELARQRLSESAAARKYGVNQQWVNRRMTGLTPWKVAELADFCEKLDLSYTYIAAGGLPIPPDPPGAREHVATVTELRPKRTPEETASGTEVEEVSEEALNYVALAETVTLRLTAECSARLSYRGLGVTLPQPLCAAA